jgi:hypothetical protein
VSASATAARHGLRLVRELHGFGSRWIAEVESPRHGRCVLKALLHRWDVGRKELMALRRWAAAGATLPARLLDEPEPGVALVEWIPGALVADGPRLEPDEAFRLGHRLHELHQPVAGGRTLLHGDLNARNLIRSGTEIRCIDPLGKTGDPVEDLAYLAVSNPAADRRLTFRAACEGYGVDPDLHAEAFASSGQAWAELIIRRDLTEAHPVDDLVELLAEPARA